MPLYQTKSRSGQDAYTEFFAGPSLGNSDFNPEFPLDWEKMVGF